MIGLRQRYWKRFGAALGGLALGVQLVLATAGLVIAAAAAPDDSLGIHALCLAGDGAANRPTQPVGDAPATPVHAHDALCCLWHHVPSVPSVASLPTQPVAYVVITAIGARGAPILSGLGYGPNNARAPPTPA
jgi:hypothetical protein